MNNRAVTNNQHVSEKNIQQCLGTKDCMGRQVNLGFYGAACIYTVHDSGVIPYEKES